MTTSSVPTTIAETKTLTWMLINMLNIAAIFKAWQAGKAIKNPEKWKTGTELTNYLTAIITGILVIVQWQFPDVIVTEEMVDLLLQIFGGALVLINIVSTRITTTKEIGLRALKKTK